MRFLHPANARTGCGFSPGGRDGESECSSHSGIWTAEPESSHNLARRFSLQCKAIPTPGCFYSYTTFLFGIPCSFAPWPALIMLALFPSRKLSPRTGPGPSSVHPPDSSPFRPSSRAGGDGRDSSPATSRKEVFFSFHDLFTNKQCVLHVCYARPVHRADFLCIHVK